MNNLFQALPAILRQSGADEQVREQMVFAVWRKVAGEAVAQASAPVRLNHQTLRIAVLDQSWKTQLEKIGPEYLARINRLLGGQVVTFIEFQVDRAAVRQAHPDEPPAFAFQHTDEIMNELQAAAEKIKDEDLREAFLHAAARSLERKEEKDSHSR